MADAAYKTYNLLARSTGITARPVDDTLTQTQFLNEDNCEELAENAVGSRLGTRIINRGFDTVDPLSGIVYSVAKLAGLNGAAWRYAGSGTDLYRRTGLTQGPYTNISSTMSGQPWMAIPYRPDISSMPYLFFSDAAGMLKDNGSFSSPQQMGIFQPQFPVLAAAQDPDLLVLDNYTGTSGDYTYTGISGGTIAAYVNTTLANAVTATGLQTVMVSDPQQVGLFQLLTVGSGGGAEVVLVIFVTPTSIEANFTKLHALSDPITSAQLQVTVPANTTATVSKSFSGTPITAWPATLQQADYIGLYLYVSDPAQVQSITLKFDCGDGSFNTDYFYRTIGQGPLQSFLNPVNDPTTSATDFVIADALGLYGQQQGGISPLNSGLAQFTPLLMQLSDFSGSGRADFNDPVFNWQAVNGYQIEIVTNDNASITVGLAALILMGGAGPDSLGGVAYDYLFTFYNNVDGTESNPCMVMSNINPPLQTDWVVPRRQPVLLTMTYPKLDPQTTSLRIYRRGGTLGDNYRRVDEVLITGSPQKYTDISSDADIQSADFVSFVNDVPVTSTLPVPVNTTLNNLILNPGLQNVFPTSMANISVGQQVTIGNIAPPDGLLNNSETVVVYTLASDHFTAYVQNAHAVGELVYATAKYGQPVTIMAQAFEQMWFAGDPNNPHYLYWSAKSNPQAVSSAAYVEVGTPDDPITAIVKFKGNLYVSTRKFWWSIAPGSNEGASPTPYPTAAKHGCVAVFGWLATEEAIFYQAIDGIRAFAGGASTYLTQDQEFIFQGVGTSPIVEAEPSQLSQTRAAYWNNMLFFSYVGTDTNRHRLIFHTIYKRWRNDDVDAQSILLEADTNTLIFGDSNGLVRQDRIGTVDEGNDAGTLVSNPIEMDLQWGYNDQGMPVEQKNYQEFTLDVNTNGQVVTVELLFNDQDGEDAFTVNLGTITTTGRERVNANLNSGEGFEAYKVSLRLTCSATEAVYIYQAAIRALRLAMTRQSLDTYVRKFSTDESKICKQVFIEYTSSTPVPFTMTYDDPAWPPYNFTLPSSGGNRIIIRKRLPAVKFRWQRMIALTATDFMIWDDSSFEIKPVCSGKGYEKFNLSSTET